MQVTVMSVFLWALLLAAQIEARPQELGAVKATRADMAIKEVASDVQNNPSTIIITTTTTTPSTSAKPKNVGSRVEPSNAVRDLKGYQYMDNSLRSVTTQLLNVSSTEVQLNVKDNMLSDKAESRLGQLTRNSDDLEKEILSDRDHINDNVKSDMVSVGTADIEFDRPINSKFNYFKTSHPGEAMAMTDEDLERELALSKLMTTPKKKPTTTGGISTWILLNPPSTTVKPSLLDKNKNVDNKKENVKKTTLSSIKPTVSTANIDTDHKANFSTNAIEKISPTRTAPVKSTSTIKQSPTTKLEQLSIPTVTHMIPRIETSENNFYTTAKSTMPRNDDVNSSTLKTTTKRVVSSNRTVKPTITTPKTTTVISHSTTIKVSRPSNPNQSTKSNIIRKVISKPETTKNFMNVTSKIEKVTFRPVQMITTPKSTIQQSVPMFITKLQTSFHTDSKSNAPSISTAFIEPVTIKEDTSKMNGTFIKRVQNILKQNTSKPNTVLNVQLKKPVETQTKLEVQPIRVNAPVLTIEKVGESEKNMEIDVEKPIEKGDSKINVKFVFNPELTKIIETPAEISSEQEPASVSPTTTTTKRPKQKRKKNKIRRRRPSSTTPIPITTPSITILNTRTNTVDTNLTIVEGDVAETSLQESKIVPDSDASTNKTKNKKKEVDKPITSQIYSFLSRDVMPSFGVMSLVGLGLGLASYFLYPFGGTIARRNYEIQPNYQYNLDEYGGNYGQSEEEVFSKVLQGMSTSDDKYGGMKDYENNYYRYQAYDGAYADPSYAKRRGDVKYPASSMPIYRPNNTPLPYNSKYRKNEFHYPDISTTPKHHNRYTESEYVSDQVSDDRQFVVGNVPKGYLYENKPSPSLITTTESIQTDFEKQIAQSLKFVENPENIPEAQALKVNEGYEEIEIAPTAVAVEHGPRFLKLDKFENSKDTPEIGDVKTRRKRESFIQQIPSRSEMEKMEKEEDLSNEILDILDSAIDESPGIRLELNVKTDDSLSTVSMTPSLINLTNGDFGDKSSTSATVELTTSKRTITTIDESIITTSESSRSSTVNSSPGLSTNFTLETREPESIDDSNAISISTDTPSILNSTTTPMNSTTSAPTPGHFNFVNFIKKLAEIKLRVGLTVLKHASESFAKYLGNVQKRLNDRE